MLNLKKIIFGLILLTLIGLGSYYFMSPNKKSLDGQQPQQNTKEALIYLEDEGKYKIAEIKSESAATDEGVPEDLKKLIPADTQADIKSVTFETNKIGYKISFIYPGDIPKTYVHFRTLTKSGYSYKEGRYNDKAGVIMLETPKYIIRISMNAENSTSVNVLITASQK
jgi:hypothetical protein